MPPTLADIIYWSFQAKFSRLVRKFSNMNALLTCVIEIFKKTILGWRSKHWKETANKRLKKITRPFTSLPTKFKTRFCGPASLTDIKQKELIFTSLRTLFARIKFQRRALLCRLCSVAAAIFHCGVGLKVRTAHAKFILGLFPRSYFDLKSQFSRY